MPELSMGILGAAYNKSVSAATPLQGATFGFTADQILRATAVHLSCTGADIRYTYDGTTPTASIGHPLAAGAETLLRGNSLVRQLQIIQQASGAVVNAVLLY